MIFKRKLMADALFDTVLGRRAIKQQILAAVDQVFRLHLNLCQRKM